MGYPSLYEFCIQELKYSEGTAYRRISVARLLRELPEIKEKVDSGVVNLTSLSQAQSFFNKRFKENAPLQKEEKMLLIERLENKSHRECEKEILKLDPKAHRPDQARQINNDLTEIRLTVDSEFMAVLNRLRERLSSRGILENKDVIFHALKTEVTRLTKNPKEVSAITYLSKHNIFERKGRIVIPHSLRALVHTKSNWECSYVNPQSHKKCSSRHFLQIDHIIPVSRGGTNNLNNLQLMCSAHNQLKSDN